MDIGGKIPRWLWLAALGVFGIAILIVTNTVSIWPGLFSIVRDVGIATLSASILGLTIDRWLKSDIAKDVFNATI